MQDDSQNYIEVVYNPGALKPEYFKFIEDKGDDVDDGIYVPQQYIFNTSENKEEECPEHLILLADECFGLPYSSIVSESTPQTILINKNDVEQFNQLFAA